MNQPQYNQGQPMQQPQQNNDYVNGLFIDYTQTQYGTITKLGIHRDNFINWLMQQQVSEKGYVKVDILTAKETGKPYAKLNTYQAPQRKEPQQQYQQQPQTPPPYTGNMGQPQQYQQPMPAHMPNEPVYSQQPGPAVQQGQPYNDSNVPF